MRSMIKIVAGIVLFGVLIQLYPVNRKVRRVPETYDIIRQENLPGDLAKMLKTACYNCHSNQTHYPRYAYFAPVSWYVQYHVNQARKVVNFSRWKKYSSQQKNVIIENVIDKIQSRSMPLGIYVYVHPNAKLSDEDRKEMIDWFDALQTKKIKRTDH